MSMFVKEVHGDKNISSSLTEGIYGWIIQGGMYGNK